MPESNHLNLGTYQALAEFRYQIRRFVHFSEEVARRAGLEPQQHQLMLAVKGAPAGQEPRIAYLAERLQLRHHSAVELVDRLARKGLVRRVRSDFDRREVHVKLTPSGNRMLDALTRHTRAELKLAAPVLVGALKSVTTGGRLADDRVRGGVTSLGARRRTVRRHRLAEAGSHRTRNSE
jgi:DNA-binding MarR family transcriptional regulator